MPIRKDDEVQVVRRTYKGRDGKAVQVRNRWIIHIERLAREKVRGATVKLGIGPPKVMITKVKLDKHRKALLEHKKGAQGKDSNKFSEADVDTMEALD